MNKSKIKGTSWESEIVRYLRECGVPSAERRALHGNHDRGDLAGIPGVVVEAKNAARLDLAGWLDEAEIEQRNDHADLGVVWFKRRGRTSAGRGYVLMSGDAFVGLLIAAGYLAPVEPSTRPVTGPPLCPKRG